MKAQQTEEKAPETFEPVWKPGQKVWHKMQICEVTATDGIRVTAMIRTTDGVLINEDDLRCFEYWDDDKDLIKFTELSTKFSKIITSAGQVFTALNVAGILNYYNKLWEDVYNHKASGVVALERMACISDSVLSRIEALRFETICGRVLFIKP